MNAEHDLIDNFLAHWVGLARSPALYGIATDEHSHFWREEEAAVLAIQALARALGVNLVQVAERISRPSRTTDHTAAL